MKHPPDQNLLSQQILHAMSSSLHPGQPSVTYIASADNIVELARNTISPVRCDWGAGTRTECNVMLGSWNLLNKHLHTIHCQRTRDGYTCRLSKCNCQLHFSQQALLDHVDSAHLSRIPLLCPIPSCISPSFKGPDSLIKHFEEKHRNLQGTVIKLPATDTRPIMKDDAISLCGQKSPSLSPPPLLPRRGEMQPGSALVMNVHIKWKMGIVDDYEWLNSQPGMSQSQVFTSSQGPLTARKQRTKAKQLEKKVKKEEEEEEEEEEGIASIVLDDLAGLSLANHPRVDVDARHHRSRWVGMRSKGRSWESGRNHLELTTLAEREMILGQRSEEMFADLSRPQSMLAPEVISKGEDARAPRSILFDVAARKVDEQESKVAGAASTSG